MLMWGGVEWLRWRVLALALFGGVWAGALGGGGVVVFGRGLSGVVVVLWRSSVGAWRCLLWGVLGVVARVEAGRRAW